MHGPRLKSNAARIAPVNALLGDRAADLSGGPGCRPDRCHVVTGETATACSIPLAAGPHRRWHRAPSRIATPQNKAANAKETPRTRSSGRDNQRAKSLEHRWLLATLGIHGEQRDEHGGDSPPPPCSSSPVRFIHFLGSGRRLGMWRFVWAAYAV